MELRDISKLKLFTWDEIGNDLLQVEPADQFMMNAEGGWTTEGWSEDLKVEIRTTGQHFGLETWAETIEEAHDNFSRLKVYQEYCEADNEANG